MTPVVGALVAAVLWLSPAARADDPASGGAKSPAAGAEAAEREAPQPEPAQAEAAAPQAPAAPEPIGLADFARFPYGTLPALSPDGTQMAVVYRADEDRALAVRGVEEGAPPARLFGVVKDNPRYLRWPKPERVVLSVERYQGRTTMRGMERAPDPPRPVYRYNPVTRRTEMVGFELPPLPQQKEMPAGRVAYLYSFHRDRGRGRHLGRDWPVPVTIQDDVLSWLPADPRRVLISVDEVERFATQRVTRPGVATMSLGTGALQTVVWPTRHVQRWFADHDGNVLLGEGDLPDGSAVLFRREGRRLVEVPTYVSTLEAHARFAAHAYDPDLVYAWAPIQGRQALVMLRLSDSAVEAVYAHPRFDVTGPLVFDEAQRKLVGVGYVADDVELHALDESLAQERERMARALPGVALEIVSESLDKRRALVRASSDVRPPAYYLYDREQSEMRLELSEYPWLDGETLQPMLPVRYFARDGLEIPAYLTRPPGNPAKAPAIVMVHDGPAQRVHRRFDPLVQWLARSGFAVLEPNYRGSTGYGLELRSAGSGEWGGAMQDDLEDGARWLAAEGIADPRRIGIYGRGYGGYAALLGALRASTPFRAAASHGGPTDLVELLEDDEKERVEPDWSRSVMGARKQKRSRLVELSPISHVAKLERPVLLLHSEHDERVRVEHSARFAKLAAKVGKPVEVVVFDGELYELAREEHRMLWFEKLTAFFEKSLAPPPEVPAAPAAAPEAPSSEEKAS
jgi:dipeptidyl aminopeptidase/acylaminoacyl peptidase